MEGRSERDRDLSRFWGGRNATSLRKNSEAGDGCSSARPGGEPRPGPSSPTTKASAELGARTTLLTAAVATRVGAGEPTQVLCDAGEQLDPVEDLDADDSVLRRARLRSSFSASAPNSGRLLR